jgi:HK97 family phage prohead protease
MQHPVDPSEFATRAHYDAYCRAAAAGLVRQHGVGRVIRGTPSPDLVTLRGSVCEIAAGGIVRFAITGRERGSISGIAVSWGKVNRRNMRVERGAFAKSLARTPLPMLMGHDSRTPVGRWDRLTDQPDGLRADGVLNLSTPQGQLAFAHLEHHDIRSLSIGFRVADHDGAIKENMDGSISIFEADLLEVSLVAIPADERALVDSVAAGGIRNGMA